MSDYTTWRITKQGKRKNCKHNDTSTHTTDSDSNGYTHVYDHKRCNDCKQEWIRNGD